MSVFFCIKTKYSSPSPDMPKELRLQAVRAAVLLLPDENREALRTLLCLLSDVTASVSENQMTPTNLAVCLAPSLFHLNTLRRKESSSPRCVFVSSPTFHNFLLCHCNAALDKLIVLRAYIMYTILYMLKTGKGNATKEQDTVDRG